MRKVIVLMTLCLNFIVGSMLATAAGLPAISGGLMLNSVAILAPNVTNSLRAGIYTEVWTGEMIKKFRSSMESIGWINLIRSYDQYAENDIIHFVNIGGDPTVLINNTTYPIGIENLGDTDKAVSLDKFQTLATRITDDELHAISYDKMASVIERHLEVINEKKYSKALHAIAPATNATATPVLLTTGANSTDGSLRKTLLKADIIALKKKFDDQKIPVIGRVLVLCPDHVNDLLANDQKFADQYYNYQSGKIANLYGFQVFEYTDVPYFTVSTKTKIAYGAIPAATERQASVAFYAPRMMKATGTTKAYLSEAKSNPLTQENLLNYRHYFIALPLKNEAIGAIVSDIAV